MIDTIAKRRGAGVPTAAWVWAVFLGAALLVTPEAAMAQSNVNNMAESILTLLTGPLAKTFAAIAVVIAGFLYFTGRGSAQTLVSIIVGFFLVFSARWLVGLIAG